MWLIGAYAAYYVKWFFLNDNFFFLTKIVCLYPIASRQNPRIKTKLLVMKFDPLAIPCIYLYFCFLVTWVTKVTFAARFRTSLIVHFDVEDYDAI